MSEIRRDEIIYEEGWRDSAPPADIEQAPVDEAPETKEEKPPYSKPLLLTVQLILCLLFALALFLLKSMDSDIYRDFIDYYREELNKPIVSQGVFDALDVSRLFGGDPVTVDSTPDEAADI